MPRFMDIDRITESLRTFHLRERRMPGYNEMLGLFGYRSKNSVFNALRILEEQGYLAKDANGKIAATAKLTGSIRLLGKVQAGMPVDASQVEGEAVRLEDFLVPRPEHTYLLEVQGDSMIDAGIQEGDHVLVEAQAEPRLNDIVVACVDGDWTLKRFTRDSHGPVLLAANRSYLPIRAKQSLRIAGVVRGVVRRYLHTNP